MFFPRLVRLCCALAVMTLLAASCGGEATIDAGTRTESAATDNSSRNSDSTEPTAEPVERSSDETEPTAVPQDEGNTSRSSDDDNDDDADDDAVVLQNRDEAIAFITAEGIDEGDAGCIVDGAYEVFGTWDFAELDPDPAQDEELDRILDECITVIPGPAAGSPPPGTDAELDVLWVACTEGSASACDDLFWQAPVDSDYEAYGLSCGGRSLGFCADVLGDDSTDSDEITGPPAGSPAPGTDAELDVLWVACSDGSAEACDDLFWQAPVGSDYEAFGLSCGGVAYGSCEAVLGDE